MDPPHYNVVLKLLDPGVDGVIFVRDEGPVLRECWPSALNTGGVPLLPATDVRCDVDCL